MTSVEGPAHPEAPAPRTYPEPGTSFQQFDTPTDPHPLGRHKLHDPRSRRFDAKDLLPRAAIGPTGAAVVPTQDTTWPRHCGAWNQGTLSCCTTDAALGLLMCEPFYSQAVARARARYWAGVGGRVINGLWQFLQLDAIELYKYETRLDETEVPGIYPPVDTGSTGLWSMKTLLAYDLITQYNWAFDLATALSLLANTGPISIGTLWYDSMYYPSGNGVISIASESPVRGAHQYMLNGVYPSERLVALTNSWGRQWGLGGEAYLTWDTLERLLAEGGDVVIPSIS